MKIEKQEKKNKEQETRIKITVLTFNKSPTNTNFLVTNLIYKPYCH